MNIIPRNNAGDDEEIQMPDPHQNPKLPDIKAGKEQPVGDDCSCTGNTAKEKKNSRSGK